MTYSDDLGTWEALTTSPLEVDDSWKVIPGAIEGSELVRISFITDWAAWNLPSGYRSFGWMRIYYEGSSSPGVTNSVSPARRIFPKEESMILEFPIAPGLLPTQGLIRRIGVRRVKQKYPTPVLSSGQLLSYGSSQPPTLEWSLSIDYLI